MQVDERERQRDVERLLLGGVCPGEGRVHTGDTWQIRLNYSCAAAMRAAANITMATHEVFLVQVDERERQRDVERLLLGGVGGTLARLERDHEIDPASRTTSLERRDELGAEDVGQQALELAVDSCSAS